MCRETQRRRGRVWRGTGAAERGALGVASAGIGREAAAEAGVVELVGGAGCRVERERAGSTTRIDLVRAAHEPVGCRDNRRVFGKLAEVASDVEDLVFGGEIALEP